MLSPWGRNDRELPLLHPKVISPIGLPGLLIPRCEFHIDVPDQVRGDHSEFYPGYIA